MKGGNGGLSESFKKMGTLKSILAEYIDPQLWMFEVDVNQTSMRNRPGEGITKTDTKKSGILIHFLNN